MSGLEVAGVVLGAVPILISALENYQKLGKKRDAFRKKSLHIDRIIRAFRWQHRLIYVDIKIVLRNAGLGHPVEIGDLEGLLKRQDVQDAMSDFLGDSCSDYLDILRQCEKSLVDVWKAVKGFQEGSWIGTGSLAGMVNANQGMSRPGNDFWKRVRFSMHKDDLESSIQQIDEHSRLLERLREKSQQEQQVIVQSNSSSTKGVVRLLQRVQDRAWKLYQALAKSWLQSCQNSHGARLYLENRMDSFETNKEPMVTHSQGKVEFSITLESCVKPSYCTCLVEVVNTDDSAPENGRIRKPAVSFMAQSLPARSQQRPPVDDMCKVMTHCVGTKELLKLYLVENGELSYEQITSDISNCRLCHIHMGKMISLHSLLHDPAYKQLLQQQVKQRVKLAVLMASSALQLHGTPWFRSLRKECLLFGKDVNGNIDLKNPFVDCHVDSGAITSNAYSQQADEQLLDLGIIILELWHNEAIETFTDSAGLILEDTHDSRQSVARKWIAETKDNMLTSIYDASVRCVNCRFDVVNVDLMNKRLTISIFESVIKPLWDNCKDR